MGPTSKCSFLIGALEQVNLSSHIYGTHWDNLPPKPDSVRASVDVPAPLYRELKEQAAPQGRSIRELLVAGAKSVVLKGADARAASACDSRASSPKAGR